MGISLHALQHFVPLRPVPVCSGKWHHFYAVGGMSSPRRSTKQGAVKKEVQPAEAAPEVAKPAGTGDVKAEGSTFLIDKSVDLYVVLADDSVNDHKTIKKLLRSCGLKHIVTSVYNGTQLLDLLQKKGFYRIDFPRLPDLIIIDVTMPLMDGFSVLQNIKQDPALKGIRVCVLGDGSSDNEEERAAEYGADGFFMRPFSPDTLSGLLTFICESKRV